MVRELIATSNCSGSKFKSELISIKTGFAPMIAIAAAEAIKELGTVITSSPGPIPRTFSAITSASVPELTPIVYLQLISFENLSSNNLTSGPNINVDVSICLSITAII